MKKDTTLTSLYRLENYLIYRNSFFSCLIFAFIFVAANTAVTDLFYSYQNNWRAILAYCVLSISFVKWKLWQEVQNQAEHIGIKCEDQKKCFLSTREATRITAYLSVFEICFALLCGPKAFLFWCFSICYSLFVCSLSWTKKHPNGVVFYLILRSFLPVFGSLFVVSVLIEKSIFDLNKMTYLFAFAQWPLILDSALGKQILTESNHENVIRKFIFWLGIPAVIISIVLFFIVLLAGLLPNYDLFCLIFLLTFFAYYAYPVLRNSDDFHIYKYRDGVIFLSYVYYILAFFALIPHYI